MLIECIVCVFSLLFQLFNFLMYLCNCLWNDVWFSLFVCHIPSPSAAFLCVCARVCIAEPMQSMHHVTILEWINSFLFVSIQTLISGPSIPYLPQSICAGYIEFYRTIKQFSWYFHMASLAPCNVVWQNRESMYSINSLSFVCPHVLTRKQQSWRCSHCILPWILITSCTKGRSVFVASHYANGIEICSFHFLKTLSCN